MRLFFVCTEVVSCWEQIGIQNIVRKLLATTNDLSTMLFYLFDRFHMHQRYLAAMFLWSLWKNYDSKHWDSVT